MLDTIAISERTGKRAGVSRGIRSNIGHQAYHSMFKATRHRNPSECILRQLDAVIKLDDVRRPLCHGINTTLDISTRNNGHNTRIHDSQSFRPINSQSLINNAAVLAWQHGASACWMAHTDCATTDEGSGAFEVRKPGPLTHPSPVFFEYGCAEGGCGGYCW